MYTCPQCHIQTTIAIVIFEVGGVAYLIRHFESITYITKEIWGDSFFEKFCLKPDVQRDKRFSKCQKPIYSYSYSDKKLRTNLIAIDRMDAHCYIIRAHISPIWTIIDSRLRTIAKLQLGYIPIAFIFALIGMEEFLS